MIKNQKGSMLYFSILILGILFSAGMTVTTILVQRIGMIEVMTYSTSAFYSADAGIEKVLYRWNDIDEDDNVFDWEANPEYTDSLEEGQEYYFRKDIDTDNDLLIIVSRGSFYSDEDATPIRRGIQVTRPIY